jgi:hypothetical protein
MKIVWHIFKKDAFRLRWILVLWLALPVVQMIYTWLAPLPLPERASAFEVTRYFFALLTTIQAVVTYLLVMSLIDDDLLAGHQAFWPTRPISGRQLLGAKLLGLVVLLWLAPVAVMAPWWLVHGYGWYELGTAARSVALKQAGVTLLALPLAALSPKSGVFLVLTGVGLLAPFLGLTVTFAATRAIPAVQDSRGYISMVLWLATVVGVTAHQFLTRRTLRSAGLFVVGWVGIFCVLRWWPWDFASRMHGSRESPLAANLVLQADSATVPAWLGKRPAANNGLLKLKMRYSGLPASYGVIIDPMQQTFTWRTQPRPWSPSSKTIWYSTVGGVARAMALGGSGSRPQGEFSEQFYVDQAGPVELLLHEAPAYCGVYRGRIVETVVVADVPLQVGASMQRNGHGLKIETLQATETGGLHVGLKVFSPESFAESIVPSLIMTTRTNESSREFYFLVNRQLGQVESLTFGPPEALGIVGAICVYRTDCEYKIERSSPSVAVAVSSPLEPGWRLVKVISLPVTTFERTVTSPRLNITQRAD